MKLSKERISIIAKALTGRLIDGQYIKPLVSKEHIVSRVEYIITNDLSIEDKLNEDVKKLLKAYEREIEKGEIDYWKMFNMIKNKLAKERGLIL